MTRDRSGSYPLILNKVRSPQFITPLLSRPRLLDWLSKHQDSRAVVIAADAGYGKTTLLWQWEQAVDFPCYWYKLDQLDRDWSVQISYLIASIRARHPGFGEKAAAMLFDLGGPGPNRPIVTSHLLAEMHERLLSPCTFIIDDWQFVGGNGEVRGLWNQILRDAPRTCRFVFLSRGKPQLQFARFAVHQGYGELPRAALRFSRDEIVSLFRHVYETPLEPSELVVLEEKTEGWAVGLQLIHASLQDRSGPADRRALLHSVEASIGSPMFSFLAEEVMEQLSAEHRNFLLSTSILGQVTPELGARLAGKANAAQLLQELEARALFTYRVDKDGQAYRYHGLFRAYLERRLATERTAEEVTGLHIHAASYFETTARWPEAITHFFLANLQPQAARLVSLHGEGVASEGKLAIVETWLDRLPARAVSEDARLGLLQGEVLGFVRGRWADAETHVTRALGYFRRKKDGYHEALACLKLSSLYQYQGRAEESAAAARRGLTVPNAEDPILRFRLDGNLAITAMWMESLAAVEAACRSLASQAEELGIPHFVAIGKHNLGIVQTTMGNLSEGLLNLRSAYEYWSSMPGSPFADAADYVRALLIQGETETANSVATDAAQRTRPWPRPHAEALLGVAACSIHVGEYDEGLRVLRRLGTDAARLGGLNEQASLLLIDALYLSDSHAGMEDALLALEAGPRDPRLEAESTVAQALAEHRLGKCTSTCKRSLQTLDEWNLRRADLAVVREQIRLAPLLRDHRNTRSLQLAKDGLIGAIRLGITAYLSPWLRRCAPLVRQFESDDQGLILPALIQADPAFWQQEAIQLLPKFSRVDQRAVLEAIARDATPRTLVLLGQAEGPEAAGTLADLQARHTPSIYISLFGHLAVHVGSPHGPKGDLSKRRVRHLLGVLAAHEGRTVRRDVIMDWLWPESDPGSATNSLNQTVFQLRKVLHRAAAVDWNPPYLIAESDALALNPSLVQTDLGEFRELARRYSGGGGRESLEIPRRMIDIVQDSYLAELQYEDWASSVQGDVHSEVREGLLRIAEPSGSTPPDLAFKAATAALRLDQFDEQASAAAAMQLSAGGRTKAAVALLQTLQARFQSEFGDDLPDDLLGLLNTLRRAVKSVSTKS